jgi:hypothetical protein
MLLQPLLKHFEAGISGFKVRMSGLLVYMLGRVSFPLAVPAAIRFRAKLHQDGLMLGAAAV